MEERTRAMSGDVKQALIYIARLRKNEQEAIFALDAAFPGSNLKTTFLGTVNDVCVDRLIRASNCLAIAKKMVVETEEEELRTAVGRAYYSIHHAIRALALHHNKWDPDGHEESIQEFKRLLGDKPFRDKAGLSEKAWKSVVETRTNRHVADYSPYDTQREQSGGKEYITGNRWADAARFNIEWAETILDAAFKVVGL